MYAAIRRDRLADPTRQAEFARRLDQGLSPRLRAVPGCVACFVVAAEDGAVVAIGVFRDRGGAEAGLRLTATWIAEQVGVLVAGEPELTCGEVTAYG